MSDPNDLISHKQILRRELRSRRAALTERPVRSAAIMAHVAHLDAFHRTRAIHSYMPIGSEVDSRLLIRTALAEGKTVAIPIIDTNGTLRHSWITGIEPEAFKAGPFGTLIPLHERPAWPTEWQLTIVPLLAFDRAGYRLGYGKGYYDRLLATTSSYAIGVAFAIQEVPQLPRAPHDRRLDLLVTENGPISLTS